MSHSPAPQEVDAAIVSDPKQPRLHGTALVELVQLPIGLEQGLLHNVFPIHYRTGHAGAVAVPTWAQHGDCLDEGQVACLEGSGAIDILAIIHGVLPVLSLMPR